VDSILLLAAAPEFVIQWWHPWFVAAVVALVFTCLAMGWLATDVVLMLSAVVLVASGILTLDEAISGLANKAVVMVAVLFVVGAAVRHTGAVDMIAGPLFGRPKTLMGALARLTFPTAFLSAFMNNTPLVAMLIPPVIDFAKRQRISASKLMIPLSYASILGGTCTLIGTSTNLVAQGYLEKSGYEGLNMFDIAWVGVPAAIVGCLYLIFIGPKLLPDRQPVLSMQDDVRQYTVEMLVEAGSPLEGKSIEDAGLRHLQGVYLAEIDRNGSIMPAVSPQETLRGGDRLLFVGIVDSVVELQRIRGLIPANEDVFKLNHPRPQRCLVEAVVSNTYPFIGVSIRDSKFRSQYNAVVVAVARNGERLHQKIGEIVLHPGDTLLVEAHPSFAEQHKNSRDFFLVSALAESTPPRHESAILSLIILGLMVLAIGLVDVFEADLKKLGIPLNGVLCSMIAAAAMVGTRCISIENARKSIEWETLLSIAAAIGLGIALEKTGIARETSNFLMSFSNGNPYIALAAIYFSTLICTELVTNNAAAVIMMPFALGTAKLLGCDYVPFTIAVMMAASNGFATPIGYQTHLMVYGPGGYRFSDYLKIGIPLDILIGIITIVLAPVFFPFK
jgi:di/tricarboxylate transporter